MGEAGRDLDLTEEALGPESGRQLGPEHLDGHGAAVFQVLSQVHRCHAAVAELPVERVASDKGGLQTCRSLGHAAPRRRTKVHHTDRAGMQPVAQGRGALTRRLRFAILQL